MSIADIHKYHGYIFNTRKKKTKKHDTRILTLVTKIWMTNQFEYKHARERKSK